MPSDQPQPAAILAQLERLLAAREFRTSDRLSSLLRFLVQQALEGRASQLKELVIASEVFHRTGTYDPREDATVRVAVGKLRTRLREYYAREPTDRVVIEVPTGTYVPAFRSRAGKPDLPSDGADGEDTAPPRRAEPPRRKRMLTRPVAVFGAAFVLAASGFSVWRFRPVATDGDTLLSRLTDDVTFNGSPAISADGKFVAWVSDRAGEGTRDIWVLHVVTRQPVRLTRGEDSLGPDFSPDGGRIVFFRPGKGIYAVSLLGPAEPRRLTPTGTNPRYSPDGKWIVYSTGGLVFDGAEVYLLPSEGGRPRKLEGGLESKTAHVWSPDSKYLLVMGMPRLAGPREQVSLYAVPVDGGSAIRIRMFDFLRPYEFTNRTPPTGWLATGNRLIFHGHRGDMWNVWAVQLDRSFQPTGSVQRLTHGTEDEESPAVSPSGYLAYSSRRVNSDLFLLSLKASAGSARQWTQLTRDAADDYYPNLSRDAQNLFYIARRSGRWQMLLRNLNDNTDKVLGVSDVQPRAVLSPDVSRIAWSIPGSTSWPVYVQRLDGEPRKICDECGAVGQWVPDSSEILYTTLGVKGSISSLDVDTGKSRPLLQLPGSVNNPRLSYDRKWLLYGVAGPETRMCVAPLEPSSLAGPVESHCIPNAVEAQWSADSKLVYYISAADRGTCVRAQPFFGGVKPFTGESKIVSCVPGGWTGTGGNLGSPQMAVADDRIVISLVEHRANIWLTRVR